jgi:hypothetical protein
MRAKDPLCDLYRDPDPSRIVLWHGNGDFGRHAWRDHAELPDSVAELPFGGRAELLARRFRNSRSDLDRTAYRQGPESDSEHTETSCNTLHRQNETRQLPGPAQIPAAFAPFRSSMPPCSKLSRRGLETSECGSLAERRPTLTASARAGVRNLRSGRKKACGAVKQKKDDEVKKTGEMSTRSATESHAAKKVRISTGVHTALASPGFVLDAQPPAQPHSGVVVDHPVRF